MLEYMLDTNICIYVIKNRPAALRERFDQLAEALCISTITLGELLYGIEKSARRSQNLEAVEQRRASGPLSVASSDGATGWHGPHSPACRPPQPPAALARCCHRVVRAAGHLCSLARSPA